MENITSFDSSQLKVVVEKYSPFFAEARKRLLVTLAVFCLSTIAGFFFCQDIIKTIINLLSLKGVNIVFTSPFQFINLSISSGVTSGFIITMPLLVYQILSFLKPALKRKELNSIIKLLPLSLLLFLFGFAFGILIMKWQITIFLGNAGALGIGNVLDISRLLSTVLITAVLMGISFESPIVLYFLLRFGIIKRQTLSKFRPWIYLGSFIFAVLLPPDSILADILLSLPLIVLFEATLLASRLKAL